MEMYNFILKGIFTYKMFRLNLCSSNKKLVKLVYQLGNQKTYEGNLKVRNIWLFDLFTRYILPTLLLNLK